MKRLCLFDFDGTLISRDSLYLFAVFARGRFRTWWSIFRSLPDIFLWKTGRISSSQAKERLFGRIFRGMAIDEFTELGKKFSSSLHRFERPEIMKIAREHIAQGAEAVIVSASIDQWIRPWAAENGFVKVIATEAEIGPDGRLTGKFRGPNCVGPRKVERILEEYPDAGEREIWAYGDSSSDDPMLAMAAHPFKVGS